MFPARTHLSRDSFPAMLTPSAQWCAPYSNGWLKFTPIGGYMMQTVEGEYCQIFTRSGKTYTGTCLTTDPSVHVHPNARELERKPENMVIRLDERVCSKEDTEKLGISAGDFIAWDPRTIVTESGFIKTRHLDDKAGTACIFCTFRQSPRKITPLFNHGNHNQLRSRPWRCPRGQRNPGGGLGAIGLDLSADEYCVSICAKDFSPYDYALTNQLVDLAKANKIKYAVDIYPFYGSDASAALHGGHDLRAGLIGPGVQASHSMERTHRDAIEATSKLLVEYLKTEKA